MKRCPFCKSYNVELHVEIGGGQSFIEEAKVICNVCYASGPIIVNWDNKDFKEDAIKHWDIRNA